MKMSRKWSRINVCLTLVVAPVILLQVLGTGTAYCGNSIDRTNDTQNPKPLGGWQLQNSGTLNDLYGLSFVDLNNGWCVGGTTSTAMIRHTSDGGGSWNAQTPGTSKVLREVNFTDTLNGWAVGIDGTILHTDNGGSTWTSQTSGTSNWLQGLDFVDSNNGWVVGNNGVILHTDNGGTTWTAQTSGSSSWFFDVDFVDLTNGWAIGDGGTILHTSNGGTTWSAQTSGTTNRLRVVDFIDSLNGWAVGYSGTILHTSTGGVNALPTAYIDSISPNPAVQGQSVTFTGHGTDNDGTIVEYNWTSSIDGKLNDSASFSTSALSLGTHTVSFAVKDNNDTWSQEAKATVHINPPVDHINITPTAVIMLPGEYFLFNATAYDSQGQVIQGLYSHGT